MDTRHKGGHDRGGCRCLILTVMAGPVPAIHALLSVWQERRGYLPQGRACQGWFRCALFFPHCHGRACPGHPRLAFSVARKAWVPATRAGMTGMVVVASISLSWPGLSRPSTPCFQWRKEGVGTRHKGGHDRGGFNAIPFTLTVMAGLVPAIHVLLSVWQERHGYPPQGWA